MTCPHVIEKMIKHVQQAELVQQLQTIFMISAGINLFGVIFYGIFASGELQDWAKAEPSEDQKEMNDEFELSQYGSRANPDVDTGSAEPSTSYEEIKPVQQQHTIPSANQFVSGQNNPFKQ